DQIDIFTPAQASVKTLQHFTQPGGSFAAGNTPAARFVRIEMHDAPRHIHHAGVFVHHHHAAGTHHAASFGDAVVIHGKIDFVGSHQRAGAAAGNHRFQLFAVRNSAGHFIDEFFHVHAKRNFVNAGLVDMSSNAEQT